MFGRTSLPKKKSPYQTRHPQSQNPHTSTNSELPKRYNLFGFMKTYKLPSPKPALSDHRHLNIHNLITNPNPLFAYQSQFSKARKKRILYLSPGLTILQMRSEPATESPSLIWTLPTLPACGAEMTISCIHYQRPASHSQGGKTHHLHSAKNRKRIALLNLPTLLLPSAHQPGCCLRDQP
jgi:hypothetical protein